MLLPVAASSVDSSLSVGSGTSGSNLLSAALAEKEKFDYNGLDFRLVVDSKSGPPVSITLVASTLQEKAAWCSDIGQVSVIIASLLHKVCCITPRVKHWQWFVQIDKSLETAHK